MSQAVARDPIQDFVQSAAVHIRKTELFFGWMILLSVLLFSVFLFVLIDHWIWEFNKPVRFLLWIALVLWSLWWFLKRVLPPMRYKIHPEYAARQFELQDPRSKDSLISWIQLNQSASNAPKSVLNFVGRYAFGFLRNSDASQVADSANLIRLSAAFFGCLLCTMIYFLASPKSGLTSTARMLMPWSNIAPATRVQFAQVTPGETTIMQGSSIPIDVTVRGLHKNEKVFLRYDLSDGQVRGQTVPMKEEIQGINYKIDFGKDSGGLHQPLTYWIHAGDAVAGPFDVRIQIVPLVAIDHIDLDFPAYTKLKPRTILQQGHFEAPEGTIANIHAVANQEMQTARIEFDPVLQNKMFISAREFLDMRVDKTQLEANWTATIDRKNSIEKKITNYRIHAVNNLKESNHDPIVYQAKIIPDLPPEIEFTANSNLAVEIPLDQALAIELSARDPDYGLTSVEIQGTVENKLSPLEPKVLFKQALFETSNDEENPRSKNLQYVFVPRDHQLKPGDQIDLAGIAKDNFHNPSNRKLDPQQAVSQAMRIRIVEPETKNENSLEPKDPVTPDAPKIAQTQNANPKEKVNWDKFRDNPKNEIGKSNSSNKNQEPSPKNQSEPSQSQTPMGGSGASDPGEQKSGSNQEDTNTQSNPSNASSSGKETPNNLETNGNSGSSNEPSDDSGMNSKQSRNPSSNGSANQDRGAFEKIQKFLEEKQSKPSEQQPNRNTNDAMEQTENNSEMSDKAGNDKAGSDKAGNDKAGNDKAGNDKAGNDKAGSDKAGSDKAGSDKAGSDKAGNDKAGNDKAGNDKAGNDKAGNDKAGSDKAGSDKAGNDKAGNDKAGNDKAGNDKAGNDKAGSDKAGSDKAGSDKAGNDKAGNDKAGNDKAGNDKAGNDKAGNDKAGNDKAGNDKAGSDKAGNDKAGSDKAGNDKAGSDKAGNDKAGNDKAGNDKAGNDKAGNDKAGNDKAGNDKAGSDKAGSDKAGNDKAGSDKAGSDKAGSDKAGSDKAGSDKAGNDKAGSDKAGNDKAGNDKAGNDKAGNDKAGNDKAGNDKAGNDKAGSDKAGNDKAGSDKAGSDKAGSDKAGNDKAGSDKAGNDKAGSDKAGSDKAGSDKAGNDKAGNDKAGSDKAGSDKAGNDKAGNDKAGMDKSEDGKQADSDKRNQKTGSEEPKPKPNQNPQNGPEGRNPSDQERKQQGDGKGSGDQKGGKQGEPKASVPNSAGSGVNNTGRTPQAGGPAGSVPSQSAEFGSEQANAEYSRKAGDMLLDYIDRQRDQPDPELLKRLDWKAEDFRRFADRWREAKEQAKTDPDKRVELEETLRNLGLSGAGQKINRLKDRNDGIRGMQEEGGRLRPPEALREQFEAFRKAAGKLGK